MDAPHEDPPPVTKWHRRDRPFCPIHDVLMESNGTKSGVTFYRCPEPDCRCTQQVAPRTIRRIDP